jgi:hypothetical protein
LFSIATQTNFCHPIPATALPRAGRREVGKFSLRGDASCDTRRAAEPDP